MDEKVLPLKAIGVDIKDTSWNGDLDYRALFEQTGDGVFIIGLDFNVLAANPPANRMLGYVDGELQGTSAEIFLNLKQGFQKELILEKRVNVFEHNLRKKDGSVLQAELSSSLVYNVEGKPAYIQLIARDIGERKKNERLLKRNVRAQSVIGEVTAALFRSTNIEGSLPEVLESLGYAVGVFSTLIFEVKNSSLRVRHRWVDPTVPEFD
ncbi:MAG TPA: PAS domain S-box protein, partial [Anaerolineales bacterium]|nr:PAS domain S-box protein [Anaerolineales bacterium]